jgi:hypothetical protein
LSTTRCGFELVAITNNPAEMHIQVCIFQTVKFHGLKKSNLGLKTQAGLSKMNVPLVMPKKKIFKQGSHFSVNKYTAKMKKNGQS